MVLVAVVLLLIASRCVMHKDHATRIYSRLFRTDFVLTCEHKYDFHGASCWRCETNYAIIAQQGQDNNRATNNIHKSRAFAQMKDNTASAESVCRSGQQNQSMHSLLLDMPNKRGARRSMHKCVQVLSALARHAENSLDYIRRRR